MLKTDCNFIRLNSKKSGLPVYIKPETIVSICELSNPNDEDETGFDSTQVCMVIGNARFDAIVSQRAEAIHEMITGVVARKHVEDYNRKYAETN